MDFAEAEISKDYKTCYLHASLPAKSIYLKRGYFIIESSMIKTDSGGFLFVILKMKVYNESKWEIYYE